MDRKEILKSSATVPGLLLAIVTFFCFAHYGLNAYFTGDDFLNLEHQHKYFDGSFTASILAVINPLTSAYRPMGGLVYRGLFFAFGFDPKPFRFACFALLVAGLCLQSQLLWVLTTSHKKRLLGTLILAYHAALGDLYASTGTVYDILCAVFYWSALLCYINRRHQGLEVGGSTLAVLLGFDLLALQSKEMAWTLPAVILLYELCYHGLIGLCLRSGVVTCAFRLRGFICVSILTLVSMTRAIWGDQALSNSSLYVPAITAAQYMAGCGRFLALVTCRTSAYSNVNTVSILGGMVLAAWLIRDRSMAFGLAFWLVTISPVAMISPRSGYVLYLPLFGLGLFAADLLVLSSECLSTLLCRGVRRNSLDLGLVGVVGIGVVLFQIHGHRLYESARLYTYNSPVRALFTQMIQLHPTLGRGTHILFTEDPFGADDWLLPFGLRLFYGDPKLWVDRAASRPHARAYDYAFSYNRDGKLRELDPTPYGCRNTAMKVGYSDDRDPAICWEGDWLSQGFADARNGTLTFADQPGATATFVFLGKGLKYIYTTGPNRGLADFYIDGRLCRRIDLYGGVTRWQARVEFGGLALGLHRATVRVVGQKNASSSACFVDVDGFEVR
jgi:hypothetical protein